MKKNTFLILTCFLVLLFFSATAQNTSKVKFMPHWLHQAQFAGYYMAKEKGIYKNLNLDVEILNGGPAAPISEIITTHRADFVTMFLSGAIEACDDGLGIINIAQLSQKSALMFVAKKSGSIENIEDFNGKKIGIWRSDFRELPLAFLDKYNIEAEIVPITSTINLFLEDGIDIMCVMWYNEYHQIYDAGIDFDNLSTFFYFDYGLNFPEDGIYCTREFYEKNTEVADNFIQATLAGWKYAFEHKDETIAVVLEYMKKSNIPANKAHQRWMLNTMEKVYADENGAFSGKLNEHLFYKTVNILYESGAINNKITFQEFVK